MSHAILICDEIIFKIIFYYFFVFFRSYSFLFAVLWWPVQWAFVTFLVTWNKYDADDNSVKKLIKLQF